VFIHVFAFGNPAQRMNVLSAIFAALAVGLFYGLVMETLHVIRLIPPVGEHAPRSVSKRSRRERTRTASAAPAGMSRSGRRQDVVTEKATQAGQTRGGPTDWSAVTGALTASGLLVVSLTFWDWATQAKMYSLHFAFMIGLLHLALRARRALAAGGIARVDGSRRRPPTGWPSGIRELHILAALIGLSLTNHFLTFLLLPGLAILLFTPPTGAPWRILRRFAATLAIAGVLPLLLYLYLPIRSSVDPLMNWGSPSTWGDFWRHVTVWQFRPYVGGNSQNLGPAIIDGLVFAANQFGLWLGAVLLLPLAAGLRYLWRFDRALFAAGVLTALLNLAYALNYSIREIAPYYVPVYIIALWCVGLGVSGFVQRLYGSMAWGGSRSVRSKAVVSSALGALFPLMALAANIGVGGHANDYTADLYIHNAFNNFRPNAVVLTDSWDLVSGGYYLQHVLGERTDVALIDKSLLRYPFYVEYTARQHPDLVGRLAPTYTAYRAADRSWVDTGDTPPSLPGLYLSVLNGFVDMNIGQRPVYFVFPDQGSEEQALLGKYQAALVPDGLGWRVSSGTTDRASTDPKFDLRGLTGDPVALDEIGYSVVASYPQSLERIATYLRANGKLEDAVGVTAQEQQLAFLGSRRDARPRLR